MTQPPPTGIAETISRYRRLLVLLLAVSCVGLVAIEPPVAADQLVARIGVAIPLLAIGLLVRFWATWHIAGRKTRELVTSGPYSYTRNPLYVGSSFAAAAVVVGLATPIAGAVAIIGLCVIYGATVRSEEDRLRLGFGPAYQGYMEQVPRFIPTTNRYRATTAPAAEPAGPDTGRSRVLWREGYTALGFTLATVGAFLTRQWLDGSSPFQP